jgi:uncharacterized membrane protein YoaK (UPF0700 family)
MVTTYLRDLSGRSRTPRADRHLAHYLTFVAGAVNAGGFLIVGHYTSHMTGIVSATADNVALRDWAPVLFGAATVGAFLSGAAATAWLVNWGRRRNLDGLYAAPLAAEAVLLLAFGIVAPHLSRAATVAPGAVAALCFVMGLQNALVTKVSRAEIRTTHVTGMITDLGIELGKLLYWNRHAVYNDVTYVRADRRKVLVLSTLTTTFFVGGVIGALAFGLMGALAAVPIAIVPLTIAAVPLVDDLRRRYRTHRDDDRRAGGMTAS